MIMIAVSMIELDKDTSDKPLAIASESTAQIKCVPFDQVAAEKQQERERQHRAIVEGRLAPEEAQMQNRFILPSPHAVITWSDDNDDW